MIAISLVALAIVIVLAANSIRDQVELQHNAAILLRDAGQAAFNADFDVAVVRAAGEAASFAVTKNVSYLDEAKEAVSRAHSALEGLERTLGGHPPTEGLESKHAGFVARQQQLLTVVEDGVNRAESMPKNADRATVQSVLDKIFAYEPLAEVLRKDVSLHREEEYKANEHEIRGAARLAIHTILANLVILLSLIAIAFFFTRRFVVKPINELAGAASAVAAGDLTQTVAVRGKDEVANLQSSFNQMVRELHRQHETLLERNAELRVSRERARDFAAALNTELEGERRRIAHALHDELGQNLTALRMYLARLHKGSIDGVAAKDLIDRAQGLVGSAGTAMRRIVADLRPLALDNFGLVAAAESLLQEFSESTGIAAEIDVSGDVDILPDTHKTALYRILQESLNNVAKHAQAASVQVRLEEVKGGVALTVRDDGRGFSREVQPRPGSYGLFGMAERAAQYGGHANVDTIPGAGTKITVWLPFVAEEPSAA